MNQIQHVLADAERVDVEHFIRRCERDTLVSASRSPIARCDECTRYAVPGQFLCTQCIRP